MKHGERWCSGRKVLTHDREGLPGEAALAANLTHDDYVARVRGSLDQLPDLFCALDARSHARPALPGHSLHHPAHVTAALPLADRRPVRLKVFREHLAAGATRR